MRVISSKFEPISFIFVPDIYRKLKTICNVFKGE